MSKLITLALLIPAVAHADDDPHVAVTVSPLHLFVPMGELTAEVRLAERVGLAGVAGAGSVRDQLTGARIGLYEGGGSLRYYATGSFRRGLQLGGEALYVHASTSDVGNMTIAAEGLGLSPFVGYKWTAASGFTIDVQGGVSFLVARAKSSTDSDQTKAIGPLLNLNVGYSF